MIFLVDMISLFYFIACICVLLLQLLICGQALSHAVNYTVRDIVKDWNRLPGYNLANIHLIVDGNKSFILRFIYVHVFNYQLFFQLFW